MYGWQTIGGVPAEIKKCVIIAAPHTSNWDLLWMLLAAIDLGIRPNWFGKYNLFRPPLGFFLRAVGGIPIDRRASNNAVEAAVATIGANDLISLAIPPEGTRGHVDHWKTGFYHIAHGAGVPIICCFLDYGSKRTGVGPVVQPSGDIDADMLIFEEFYQGMTGLHPDRFGPVQLKPETENKRKKS